MSLANMLRVIHPYGELVGSPTNKKSLFYLVSFKERNKILLIYIMILKLKNKIKIVLDTKKYIFNAISKTLNPKL